MVGPPHAQGYRYLCLAVFGTVRESIHEVTALKERGRAGQSGAERGRTGQSEKQVGTEREAGRGEA